MAMESFRMIAEIGALLCTGLFAGAALYITLVEHPARMECGTESALAEFGPSYRRAAVLQGLLAAIGSLLAIGAWLAGAALLWLMSGVLLFLVIPWTLLVIFPTNKKLLDPFLNRSSDFAHQLLLRWGRLHAVRTALSLIAFTLLLLGAF
jgi:Domain of unknown function (DUF1772)